MVNKSDPNYIEKIRIIEDLIEHYPELKKDKNILNNIFFDRSDKPNKFILDRVELNKKVYYKSNDNLLIDVNIKCHGVYVDGKFIIIRPENRKEHYDKFIEEFKNYTKKKFC
jgi:ribosomal protein L31